MSFQEERWVWITTVSTLLAGGCGMGRVFHSRPLVCESAGEREYALARGLVELGASPVVGPSTGHQSPAADQPAELTGQAGNSATRPASATSRPARRPAYTSPSPAVRQVSLFMAAGKLALPGEMLGAGREAAESSLAGTGGILSSGGRLISRPGLAVSQPRTVNAVNSRPGLQRGFAGGLGFAGRRTILTLQRNPAAGPCRELVRAGFFPNQAACESRFGR